MTLERVNDEGFKGSPLIRGKVLHKKKLMIEFSKKMGAIQPARENL
jgi:hypothetical protein